MNNSQSNQTSSNRYKNLTSEIDEMFAGYSGGGGNSALHSATKRNLDSYEENDEISGLGTVSKYENNIDLKN